MHIRKPLPPEEFVPWTGARFQTQEARDQFLSVVASRQTTKMEVKPSSDDSRGAWVRWRPGQFLGLNDIAYAHGGRIVFTVTRGREAWWPTRTSTGAPGICFGRGGSLGRSGR
jgi:hypothetical protein